MKTPRSNPKDRNPDRRFNTRVSLSAPVKLFFRKAGSKTYTAIQGKTRGISENGLSIETKESYSLPEYVDLELKQNQSSDPIRFFCKVKWSRTRKASKGSEFGLEIVEISPPSEFALMQYLSNKTLNRKTVIDRRAESELESIEVSFENSDGKRIVGFIDRLSTGRNDIERRIAIISPDLGQTKASLIDISYHLASAGFQVLRYDYTDHVGESDGRVNDFKLSSTTKDLNAAIQFVQSSSLVNDLVLIGIGLGARSNLRVALSSQKEIRLLVLVLPELDISATLSARYGRPFESLLVSKDSAPVDVLGMPVNAKNFIDDAFDSRFFNQTDTARELEALSIPVTIFKKENDGGKKLNEPVVHGLNLKRKRTKILSIPGLSDASGAGIAQAIAAEVIEEFNEPAMASEVKFEIRHPNPHAVYLQRKIERDRMRNRLFFEGNLTDQEFWNSYLDQFHFVLKIPDFRQYYVDITKLVGELKDRESILDAGCGNGGFGSWLALNSKNDIRRETASITYIGVDFSTDALELSRTNHNAVLSKRADTHGIQFKFQYVQADLNRALPFLQDSFDHVCCNLVVPYLKNPEFSLKELVRVLKPGKKLLVTTLAPNADFSRIFRRFSASCSDPQEIEHARKLLDNTSWLMEKERNGQFRFFTDSEIYSMTAKFTSARVTIFPSLDDQVKIIEIIKPDRPANN